jgi:hypothetical protein
VLDAFAAHAEAMDLRSRFAVKLSDLEDTARIDPRELVEMIPEAIQPLPDSRGSEPDRGWFAAGG